MPDNTQVACHECDLPVTLPDDASGKLLCPRCGCLLAKFSRDSQALLAVSFTALILLLMANAFPFMAFSIQGQYQAITLLQSVFELWEQDYKSLAIMVLIFILLAPLLFLSGLISVLLPLQLRRRNRFTVFILRWLFRITHWSMVEVFLIGVLVSLIKIAAMADVIPGISFWAYILFSIAVTYVLSQVDRVQLWRWVNQGHRHD